MLRELVSDYEREAVRRLLQRDHVGQARAITKQKGAAALGIEPRHFEEAVRQLRIDPHGPPICAAGNGYWIEPDLARYRENIERRYMRAIHQLETCSAERRKWAERAALNCVEPGGQRRLFA